MQFQAYLSPLLENLGGFVGLQLLTVSVVARWRIFLLFRNDALEIMKGDKLMFAE